MGMQNFMPPGMNQLFDMVGLNPDSTEGKVVGGLLMGTGIMPVDPIGLVTGGQKGTPDPFRKPAPMDVGSPGLMSLADAIQRNQQFRTASMQVQQQAQSGMPSNQRSTASFVNPQAYVPRLPFTQR